MIINWSLPFCNKKSLWKVTPKLEPEIPNISPNECDELINLICDICREKLDPTHRFAFEAFAYYFDGYDNNNDGNGNDK